MNPLKLDIDTQLTQSLGEALNISIPDLLIFQIKADIGSQVCDLLNSRVQQQQLAAYEFDTLNITLDGRSIDLPDAVIKNIANYMKRSLGDPTLNCNDFVFQAYSHDRESNIIEKGPDQIQLRNCNTIKPGTPILFIPPLPGVDTKSLRHSAISLGNGYCVQKFGQSPGLWVAKIEDVAFWQTKAANRVANTSSTLPCKVYKIIFKKRYRK